MAAPIDLSRLRELYSKQDLGDYTEEWVDEIYRSAPALLDAIESLCAEVERLRTSHEHPGYVATHNLVRQAYSDERAAIVAWMRVNGTGHLANCIQRGEHHESAQPPPAATEEKR